MTAPGVIVIGGYANGVSALRGDPMPFPARWAGTMRKEVLGLRDARQLNEVRRRFQYMPTTMSEA
jgi:hypothetical protein